MMKGYDTFFEEPGKFPERECQVCGSICEVERNRLGPTGWAEAMGGHAHLHDFFYCPHAKKDWHEQALELVQEIEETSSKRLSTLLQQDLNDLLAEHGIETDLPFKVEQ